MSKASRAGREADEYELGPILDFMRMLWSIEHSLQRISKRLDATLGVTGAQRLALLVVGRFPGLSAGDLAQILELHPSTVTGVLQRLEQKGLLARERDGRDNRRVQLTLRRRARSLTRYRTGTVESAITKALSRLPVRQVREARKTLSALASALNKE